MKIREIEITDVELFLNYWYESDANYLRGMGADKSKLPLKSDFEAMLKTQIASPYDQKKSFALILEIDGQPIGHTNINEVIYGETAKIHLHIWYKEFRSRGFGTKMVELALPIFFDKMKLKAIHCEPYLYNPSPNKTMQKLGFELVKTYTTIPGMISFEQEVNQWVLTKDKFDSFQ